MIIVCMGIGLDIWLSIYTLMTYYKYTTMEVKMELKIKIKEVTEETRELTIEERCMHSVVTNSCFIDAYRDEVRRHFDKIGFVERVYDGNVTGLFRKTTIRDATLEEYRAWAYLQLKGHCTCTERKLSSVDCDDCFLSGACIASDYKTGNDIYILKDKEIILELV